MRGLHGGEIGPVPRGSVSKLVLLFPLNKWGFAAARAGAAGGKKTGSKV